MKTFFNLVFSIYSILFFQSFQSFLSIISIFHHLTFMCLYFIVYWYSIYYIFKIDVDWRRLIGLMKTFFNLVFSIYPILFFQSFQSFFSILFSQSFQSYFLNLINLSYQSFQSFFPIFSIFLNLNLIPQPQI